MRPKHRGNCRNCKSGETEVVFEFPETIFWYGANNGWIEKNLEPKYMDAVLLFCNRCGFIGLPVDEVLKHLYKCPL